MKLCNLIGQSEVQGRNYEIRAEGRHSHWLHLLSFPECYNVWERDTGTELKG